MAFSILYCISAPLQTFCLLAMRDLHQEALLFIRAAYFRDYKSLLIGVGGQVWKRSNVHSSCPDFFGKVFFFCCSVYWLLHRSFQGFTACYFNILLTGNSPPLNAYVMNFMIAVFSLGKSCNGCNFYLTPLAHTPMLLIFDFFFQSYFYTLLTRSLSKSVPLVLIVDLPISGIETQINEIISEPVERDAILKSWISDLWNLKPSATGFPIEPLTVCITPYIRLFVCYTVSHLILVRVEADPEAIPGTMNTACL